MPPPDVARTLAAVTGPAGDLVLAAVLVAVTVAALGIAGGATASGGAAAIGAVATVAGCAALGRRVPIGAVLLAAAPLFASGWLTGTAAGVAQAMLLVPVYPLIYRLATRTTIGWALAGTALVIASWQTGAIWADGLAAANPSYFYVTAGACAVGMIVRARGLTWDRLATQASELALAQQCYAEESVRAERVRIARELHDVVAHCVSAMVVQAAAGHKLAARDPALAAAAFDHISGSARQAALEITRLVTLLDPGQPHPMRSIDELVARAQATGLAIEYRHGPSDVIDSAPGAVAYAVVQEALTNALKHAPGAAIEVTVHAAASWLTASVTNAPSRVAGLALAGTGGQHGLTGLRERVTACGGKLSAGPGSDGGWRVVAKLPAAAGDNT